MPAGLRPDHLIFAHEGNARAAASITITGMPAVLIGGAFMAIGPQFNQDRAVARNGAGNGAGGTPAAAVRFIGAAPGENVPCQQQVWPNIAQRCLTRADINKAPAPSRTDSKATADATERRAAQGNDKLSPLTAAAVDHFAPPQDDAGSNGNVLGDKGLLRQTAPSNVTAPPEMIDKAGHDDVGEMPPPRAIEQPRRRGHRHYGLPVSLLLPRLPFLGVIASRTIGLPSIISEAEIATEKHIRFRALTVRAG